MTDTETRSILTISLLAAFADGEKHARERSEIQRIAEGLSTGGPAPLAGLYQDVLMKRASLQTASQALGSSWEARQLAYEMAVCVCDADGVQSPAEQAFIAELQRALQLDTATTAPIVRQAEDLAAMPLPPGSPAGAGSALASAGAAAVGAATAGVAGAAASTAGRAAPASAADLAALDDGILKAAILNGALELLPETLSTMAIIPLQMKLVYRIGQSYGYTLDRGHIKDFLATAGVGMTSQYLEQAGRKLLGGLLGRVGGGLLGGVGRQAVSSGMSFATTYALGHVAKRYYAGGRTLSTDMLRQAYGDVMGEAQGLQQRYLPAMQEQARTLDAGKVLAMVRGA